MCKVKFKRVIMKSKRYRFVNFSNEIHEDIVFSDFPENLHVDLDIAKEIISCRFDFTKNEEKFFIADINNIKQISSEAKYYTYNSTEGLSNVLACAIIANIPTSILLGNILLKTSAPVPFKLFLSKESAITWINELKAQSRTSN